MTKRNIVKIVSDETWITPRIVKEIVQKTLDSIIDNLVYDTSEKLSQNDTGTLGRVELRNFGVFEVKRRAPRKARNPRTGEDVFLAEKLIITFKSGKEMEHRIRGLETHAGAGSELDHGVYVDMDHVREQNTSE